MGLLSTLNNQRWSGPVLGCCMYCSILWIFVVVILGALASIPLVAFGIRGFANLEECAVGAPHSLDAFNFLTGMFFVIVLMTVVTVICFVVKYFGGTTNKLSTMLRYLIAFLLVVSIIIGFCDIVYSFYIASQVYGQFDKFQQGLVNCSSSVYYSSFVSIVIVYLYVIVEVGFAVFLFIWLKIDFRGRIFC